MQSDLFSNIDEKFDLIISNPPYVEQKLMDELPIEFVKEPQIALAGGEKGIDLVQKITQSRYFTACECRRNQRPLRHER